MKPFLLFSLELFIIVNFNCHLYHCYVGKELILYILVQTPSFARVFMPLQTEMDVAPFRDTSPGDYRYVLLRATKYAVTRLIMLE